MQDIQYHVVTFFTAGPGSKIPPLKVYSMVKADVSPVINALSAILGVLSMAFIALSHSLQGRFTTLRGIR